MSPLPNFPDVLRAPDSLSVVTEEGHFSLESGSSNCWEGHGIECSIQVTEAAVAKINLQASVFVKKLVLKWRGSFPAGSRFLGDAWERGYGDLEWRGMVAERALPWYFVATSPSGSVGYGVETGCNSLCHWNVDDGGISLTLDVGNGTTGVQLSERTLEVATLRAVGSEGLSAFQTARLLCRTLCPNPRLPKQAVYGGNDWYYAYGQNSRESILRDSATLTELSPDGTNRPFMVIDDGWQGCRAPQNGGPWNVSSSLFGDMDQVAAQMKGLGVRPGLWFRPLQTVATVPSSWKFGRRGGQPFHQGITLDPSIPEVLQLVAQDMGRFRDWGFEMVKHDFSMWDVFGRWGIAFDGDPAGKTEWHFADRSRTTAEIIKDFFQTLRDAAGDAVMLIGCNTIGHLGAGLFEIQRTGDDTSGEDWSRTRKMGVNTLAFRMPQHDHFYAVDADCVGLTTKIPWELNKLWLDVLARSGTPLFVSAQPAALGAEQRNALREAFALAASPRPVAEPLDWLDSTTPTSWKTVDGVKKYAWAP